jgi:hypothetical protein
MTSRPGMPCGSDQDALAAALAAAQACGDLRNGQGLRQRVDIDVGLMAAVGARRRHHAHAVQAHVGEAHRRAGVGAHGYARRAR